MLKLTCADCGGSHKARKDKFPMELRQEKQRKSRDGVVLERKEIVTHICKKCARKRIRRNPRKVSVI